LLGTRVRVGTKRNFGFARFNRQSISMSAASSR
jgi:hypothetical protein